MTTIVKKSKTRLTKLRAEISRLYEQEMTRQQIADALGTDIDAIHYHIKEMGLACRMNKIISVRKHRPSPADSVPIIDPDNPITLARNTLASRLTERLGSFWLDGAPACLDDVMRAANRERKRDGLEQIVNSLNWRV